jgi:tetratricopeptide (TPR) repeat protein
MATDGGGYERLHNFLMEAFRPADFQMFLTFKEGGFEEVAKDVNPQVVSASEYFFESLKALKRKGLIATGFFDHLKEWLPAREPEITSLAEFCLQGDLDSLFKGGEQARRSLGIVDARNPHFVGRVAELRQLRNHFAGPGTRGVLIAVHGLGGVGKTALALQYAHAHAHEYGGGRWQVRCEGLTNLRAALAALAPDLRVDFSAAVERDVELQFRRILAELRELARTHEPHRCLLVLENVDRADLLDPAQTQRLDADDGLHILVTTQLGERDLFGPQKDRAFLPLDELLEPDALSLIEQYQPEGRFRDEAERQAALQIVRLLGGFTLPVELAAVYLSYYHSQVSCAAYLERLRTEELERLDDSTTDPQIRVRHGETRLSVTLMPTLERLSEPEQLALDYAALLPPDCVSWEWLEVLVGDQFDEFAQAVPDGYLDPWASLHDHLLSLRLLTPAAGPEEARIHRMVQAAVRSRPGFRHDRLRARLIGYGLEQCRVLEQARHDPEALRGLKPLTAWALLLIEQDPAKGVFLQSALGRLLLDLAHFREAEPLLAHALRVSEELFGPFDLKVASPLNDLAVLFSTTNRLSEAELLYRRALAITKKELGPDHPTFATALNNLAELLGATNRLDEAEPLFRRALAIHEASYGPDHPTVAIALNNLAELLGATNRPGEAEPLYRRALAIDEQSYGPDHPTVARVLNNLAELLGATNRPGEAEPLYRRALAIDEQSYGPDHLTVAIRLNNLAGLLRATNRLGEAEPLYRRALAIHEASYGPDHPNVARALNNLAGLLRATNRLGEAEPLSRRGVQILIEFQQRTGHEHPDFRGVRANYVGLLEALGKTSAQIEQQLDELIHPPHSEGS